MHDPMRIVALLADAGLPMIFITWPALLVALIPTIAIEALLIQRRTHARIGKTFISTAAANAVSTIVGVPMTWSVLFVFEMVVGATVPSLWGHSVLEGIVGFLISSPWIGPAENARWAVPLAVLVLLVPFYFVSLLIERAMIQHMIAADEPNVPIEDQIPASTVRAAVRDANLLSYGILFLLTSVWLAYLLVRN